VCREGISEEQEEHNVKPYLRRTNFETIAVSANLGDHESSFRNIEDQALSSFRKKHHLKSDVGLDLYDFSSSVKDSLTTIKNTYIAVNGDQYFLTNLVPMDIYTKDATFIVDGKEQNIAGPAINESNIFVSEEDSYTVLLVTDDENGQREVQSVSIFCKNGPEVHMESILPGSNILATIKSEDFHPNYVQILEELEMKGISSNVKTMMNGAEEENEENEEEDIGRGEDGILSDMKDFFINEKRKTELDSSSNSANNCSQYYMIQIAIAFDSTFCGQSSSRYGNAKKQIEITVAQASVRFQGQGVCAKVLVSHLEGYCKPETDPYKTFIDSTGNIGCGTNVGILDKVEKYWFDNKGLVHRKATHFVFAKSLNENIIGCAKIDNLCNNRMSYGVDNFVIFPSANLRGILLTHELGHNVGLRHVTANQRNPLCIMRPTPGADGNNYAWCDKSINHLKTLLHSWDVDYNCVHKK